MDGLPPNFVPPNYGLQALMQGAAEPPTDNDHAVRELLAYRRLMRAMLLGLCDVIDPPVGPTPFVPPPSAGVPPPPPRGDGPLTAEQLMAEDAYQAAQQQYRDGGAP